MSEDQKPFELGLVMAGAISAGAYTAGVADFLLEALEAWEKAKADDRASGARRMPDHGVRIKALAGASAGAITAAILVRALATRVTPVPNVAAPPDRPADDPARETAEFKNPFYAAWVQSIDIRHLLGGRDLAAEGAKVVSLLDSSALPEIGANVLRVASPPRAEAPPYAADPLDVYLTTANLRGVPYGLGLSGQQAGYKHKMTAYADHSQFALTWPARPAQPANGQAPPPERPPDAPAAVVLAPAGLGTGRPAGGWDAMMDAALASSAFPIGLAPRLLERKAADYDARPWQVPAAHALKTVPAAGGDPEDAPPDLADQQMIVCADASSPTLAEALQCVCTETRTIVPAWPDGIRGAGPAGSPAKPDFRYRYWNVDGGLMNNEPLELARRALARGGRNPREGEKATRAVVMIDPFPNESDVTAKYDEEISLVKVFVRMIGALKEQARFKPDELALADDEDVYSRFVISPIHVDAEGRTREPAIASAVMGGFGGFLSEAFRRHDFQLGRRNCQRFLARHLALPIENPLFEGWRDDPVLQAKYAFDDGGRRFAPIIPLADTLAPEVPLPARPTPADVELEALRDLVRGRVELVVPRLIGGLGSWLLRVALLAMWKGAWLIGQRHRITDWIVEKIEAEVARLPGEAVEPQV